MTATYSEQRATVPAEPVALAPAARADDSERPADAESTPVVAAPAARGSHASAAPMSGRDRSNHVDRSSGVAAGTDSPTGDVPGPSPADDPRRSGTDSQSGAAEPATTVDPVHRSGTASDPLDGRPPTAARATGAGEETTAPGPAVEGPTPVRPPQDPGPFLLDPALLMAAAVVDDLERTRIANENRLRQLTRDEVDSDGEERGFGLDESHPDVARLAGIVTGLAELEHQAVLQLQRTMRAHPLGAWVKSSQGVGEKQAARLLAAVGDPYWNTLHDRPRTVSELWAYCGLHTVPADHGSTDARSTLVGGAAPSPAGHTSVDTQAAHAGGTDDRDLGPTATDPHFAGAQVAARRRKGQRANWSNEAKMRAYLVAVSCMKSTSSPYRAVYLQRRATTDVTHPDWTPGHSHNDALRITAKAVLRDLWRAARDLHHPEGTPS